MKVRISFLSSVVIEGKDLPEIKKQWEDMGIYNDYALEKDVQYKGVISVENSETFEPLNNAFEVA